VTTAQSSLAGQVGAVEAAMTDLFRLAASRRLHDARQERCGIRLSGRPRGPAPGPVRPSGHPPRRHPRGKTARAGIRSAMCDELASVLAGWAEADRHVLAELLPRLVRDMRAGPARLARQRQA
jgi:hypothetical protein